MNNKIVLLLALTLPVVVIWGLNFAIIRIGVEDVGPFTLAVMRFAVASLPFMLFVARPNVPLAFLATYALFFGFLQFTFLFVGLGLGLPTGITSLLLQLQAVFTPALAFLFLRETFSLHTVAAMVLSLAGLGAVMSSAGYINGGAVTVLFGVGAAISWALSNVVVRYGVRQGYTYKPIQLVVWASSMPIIPFAILAWMMGEITPELSNGLLSGFVAAAYLGLLGTIVGYALWIKALSLFDAATVAPFSLMIPVVGLTTGYIVFSETLTMAEVIGSGLIIAGLLIHIVGTARASRAVVVPPLP
jgi:O-acetylserine/cysteine efflux transporter